MGTIGDSRWLCMRNVQRNVIAIFDQSSGSAKGGGRLSADPSHSV